MTTFADTQLVTPGRTIDLSDWENRPRYFSMPEGQYGITSTGVIYRFKRYSDALINNVDWDVYGEWIRQEAYDGAFDQGYTLVDNAGFTGEESSEPYNWNESACVEYNPSAQPYPYVLFSNTTATCRMTSAVSSPTSGSLYACFYVYFEDDSDDRTLAMLGSTGRYGLGYDVSESKISVFTTSAPVSGLSSYSEDISIETDTWYWVEWWLPVLSNQQPDLDLFGQFIYLNNSRQPTSSTDLSSTQLANTQIYVGNVYGTGNTRIRDVSFFNFN